MYRVQYHELMRNKSYIDLVKSFIKIFFLEEEFISISTSGNNLVASIDFKNYIK